MSEFVVSPRYSCTLGGALGVVRALPGKVIPIIHAAPGCGGNLGYAVTISSGYAGGGYCSGQAVPSTSVVEKDMIFGGEERLREQIENTLRIMDGDLYMVLTACMVDMIGDQTRAIAAEFQTAEKPVLCAETGGFRGTAYKGYDIAMSVLIRDYVAKSAKKEEKTVNLLGVVPIQDVFWQRDLTILKNLLEQLGLHVNTFFGEDETLENLKSSGQATLNIVLSPVYGIAAAETYQEVHGIPYMVTPFPIGDVATSAFLRSLGQRLELDNTLVESVISHNQRIYYRYLEKLVDVYMDNDLQRYVVVVGDANYAPALTKFFYDDLSWLPELVVIPDLLEENQKELVAAEFGGYRCGLQPQVRFHSQFFNLQKILAEVWPSKPEEKYANPFAPAFVAGSSSDIDFANAIGAKHISVSYPIANRVILNRGYAGYEGGLHLAEDAFTALVADR